MFQKASVVEIADSRLEIFGRIENGITFLYPEETFYMLHKNALTLTHNDRSINIPEALNVLFGSDSTCTWKEFRVFSDLVNNGFKVVHSKLDLTAINLTNDSQNIDLSKEILSRLKIFITSLPLRDVEVLVEDELLDIPCTISSSKAVELRNQSFLREIRTEMTKVLERIQQYLTESENLVNTAQESSNDNRRCVTQNNSVNLQQGRHGYNNNNVHNENRNIYSYSHGNYYSQQQVNTQNYGNAFGNQIINANSMHNNEGNAAYMSSRNYYKTLFQTMLNRTNGSQTVNGRGQLHDNYGANLTIPSNGYSQFAYNSVDITNKNHFLSRSNNGNICPSNVLNNSAVINNNLSNTTFCNYNNTPANSQRNNTTINPSIVSLGSYAALSLNPSNTFVDSYRNVINTPINPNVVSQTLCYNCNTPVSSHHNDIKSTINSAVVHHTNCNISPHNASVTSHRNKSNTAINAGVVSRNDNNNTVSITGNSPTSVIPIKTDIINHNVCNILPPRSCNNTNDVIENVHRNDATSVGNNSSSSNVDNVSYTSLQDNNFANVTNTIVSQQNDEVNRKENLYNRSKDEINKYNNNRYHHSPTPFRHNESRDYRKHNDVRHDNNKNRARGRNENTSNTSTHYSQNTHQRDFYNSELHHYKKRNYMHHDNDENMRNNHTYERNGNTNIKFRHHYLHGSYQQNRDGSRADNSNKYLSEQRDNYLSNNSKTNVHYKRNESPVKDRHNLLSTSFNNRCTEERKSESSSSKNKYRANKRQKKAGRNVNNIKMEQSDGTYLSHNKVTCDINDNSNDEIQFICQIKPGDIQLDLTNSIDTDSEESVKNVEIVTLSSDEDNNAIDNTKKKSKKTNMRGNSQFNTRTISCNSFCRLYIHKYGICKHARVLDTMRKRKRTQLKPGRQNSDIKRELIASFLEVIGMSPTEKSSFINAEFEKALSIIDEKPDELFGFVINGVIDVVFDKLPKKTNRMSHNISPPVSAEVNTVPMFTNDTNRLLLKIYNPLFDMNYYIKNAPRTATSTTLDGDAYNKFLNTSIMKKINQMIVLCERFPFVLLIMNNFKSCVLNILKYNLGNKINDSLSSETHIKFFRKLIELLNCSEIRSIRDERYIVRVFNILNEVFRDTLLEEHIRLFQNNVSNSLNVIHPSTVSSQTDNSIAAYSVPCVSNNAINVIESINDCNAGEIANQNYTHTCNMQEKSHNGMIPLPSSLKNVNTKNQENANIFNSPNSCTSTNSSNQRNDEITFEIKKNEFNVLRTITQDSRVSIKLSNGGIFVSHDDTNNDFVEVQTEPKSLMPFLHIHYEDDLLIMKTITDPSSTENINYNAYPDHSREFIKCCLDTVELYNNVIRSLRCACSKLQIGSILAIISPNNFLTSEVIELLKKHFENKIDGMSKEITSRRNSISISKIGERCLNDDNYFCYYKNPLKQLNAVDEIDYSMIDIERYLKKVKYDIYRLNTRFPNTNRSTPNYRVLIFDETDELPSAEEVTIIRNRFHDHAPLLFCIVCPNAVLAFRVNNVLTPLIVKQ